MSTAKEQPSSGPLPGEEGEAHCRAQEQDAPAAAIKDAGTSFDRGGGRRLRRIPDAKGDIPHTFLTPAPASSLLSLAFSSLAPADPLLFIKEIAEARCGRGRRKAFFLFATDGTVTEISTGSVAISVMGNCSESSLSTDIAANCGCLPSEDVAIDVLKFEMAKVVAGPVLMVSTKLCFSLSAKVRMAGISTMFDDSCSTSIADWTTSLIGRHMLWGFL